MEGGDGVLQGPHTMRAFHDVPCYEMLYRRRIRSMLEAERLLRRSNALASVDAAI
jgi:hypothetical protein